MALTPEEKDCILKALDELDKDALDKILASPKAFFEWLKKTSCSSYLKCKNNLHIYRSILWLSTFYR